MAKMINSDICKINETFTRIIMDISLGHAIITCSLQGLRPSIYIFQIAESVAIIIRNINMGLYRLLLIVRSVTNEDK